MNRFLFCILLCTCSHFSIVTSIETYGKNKAKKIVDQEAKFEVAVGQNVVYSATYADYFKIIIEKSSSNSSASSWTLYLVTAICKIFLLRMYQKLKEKEKLIQLLQLPLKEFTKEDKYDCCSICLEDYEYSDQLRILPCHHAFHSKCVDQWLSTTKRICPLCRQKVLGEDDDESSTDLF